ncbi:hypothetical protein ONV78_13185 [Hahella sp. CR1]|uniref:hypothetical protein n=1 Tax=Hahella sp. CR1 TaxID=2992807 RepID=UPI0024435341|nr:hypothetical protein [Hahella sp. CR1]MDG9668690.1 hypothetical protein [Hahella sp. CR1]
MTQPFIDTTWVSAGNRKAGYTRIFECIIKKLFMLKELELYAEDKPDITLQLRKSRQALDNLKTQIGKSEYYIFYYAANTELKKLDVLMSIQEVS